MAGDTMKSDFNLDVSKLPRFSETIHSRAIEQETDKQLLLVPHERTNKFLIHREGTHTHPSALARIHSYMFQPSQSSRKLSNFLERSLTEETKYQEEKSTKKFHNDELSPAECRKKRYESALRCLRKDIGMREKKGKTYMFCEKHKFRCYHNTHENRLHINNKKKKKQTSMTIKPTTISRTATTKTVKTATTTDPTTAKPTTTNPTASPNALTTAKSLPTKSTTATTTAKRKTPSEK
jgi:hypothetical protein